MNSVVRGFCCSALVLLFTPAIFAQSQTGSLSGTVVDDHGTPIPGISIEVRSESTGILLKTVSTDVAAYVFANIQADVWTVTAEKVGFKKLVRTGIQIFIAQRQILELRMEVGDV